MKKTIKFNDIDCAACAQKIEEHINKKGIVNHATVNFINKTLTIENDVIDKQTVDKLNDAIHEVEDESTLISDSSCGNPPETGMCEGNGIQCENCPYHISNHEKDRLLSWRYIIAILCFVVGHAMNSEALEGTVVITNTIKIIFFAVSYLLFGYDIIWKCIKNVIHGEIFDENFLMTVATIGAFAIGSYSESIAVLVFYKIGEALQDKAVEKSTKSISDLVGVKKKTVIAVIDSQEIEIPAASVSVGTEYIIRPGEMALIDGTVISGTADVDTSAITGESDLINKHPGDEIESGSIVSGSILHIKTTKKYEDSTMSRIIDIIQNASDNKSKTEKFITKFSKIYTPVFCAVALLVFVIPLLAGFFMNGELNVQKWLYQALSILVISCPCAIIISVPLTFFSGVGAAAKHGILIKGSNYLDEINEIDEFAFDKTGTLTDGSFEVEDIILHDVTRTNALSIATALEVHSTHPIAKAIVRCANNETFINYQVENFRELPGAGVTGVINGITYELGNEKHDDCDDVGVFLLENGIHIATFVMSDGIKSDSVELVNYLKKNHKIVKMLTGDNEKHAKRIADKLGISYQSALKPEDKLNVVKNDQRAFKVLFVGDGINDAPVITQADIGISMGSGSDAAIEMSDVVIGENIGKLKKFIEIGKKTRKLAIENIIFALVVKLTVLVLSACGISHMWVAIFADVGVALLCVLNAMRNLKTK